MQDALKRGRVGREVAYVPLVAQGLLGGGADWRMDGQPPVVGWLVREG